MADNRKSRRAAKQSGPSFKQLRVDTIKKGELYSDNVSLLDSYNKSSNYGARDYIDAAAVRRELNIAASSNNEKAVAASKTLYAVNPVYSRLIKYFSTLFLWRYVVTPQKVDGKVDLDEEKWHTMYMDMLDLVDGLSLEVKMPKLLTQLWIEGAVFFTSMFDEDAMAINIMVLPNKFTKKVGESIFGTGVIKFDAQYFDSLGLSIAELDEVLKKFPKEMQKGYKAFKNDRTKRWFTLDPRTSSCVSLNEKSVPTLWYAYGSILSYEGYQANELEKSGAQLENIVVHKLPTYQNELILDIKEMQALHSKLARIVETANRTRLMTTIGDVDVKPLQESETRENTVLDRAFKSVFDNAGLNSAQFTGSSKEAIMSSMRIDKNIVWSQVEEIVNFINLAINNLINIEKGYQIEVTMLPISRDTYADDLRTYRESASLGVGITSFIVASGIKQKNINSYLEMEDRLDYTNRLKPLRSSHTTSNDGEEIQSKSADDLNGEGNTGNDRGKIAAEEDEYDEE